MAPHPGALERSRLNSRPPAQRALKRRRVRDEAKFIYVQCKRAVLTPCVSSRCTANLQCNETSVRPSRLRRFVKGCALRRTPRRASIAGPSAPTAAATAAHTMIMPRSYRPDFRHACPTRRRAGGVEAGADSCLERAGGDTWTLRCGVRNVPRGLRRHEARPAGGCTGPPRRSTAPRVCGSRRPLPSPALGVSDHVVLCERTEFFPPRLRVGELCTTCSPASATPTLRSTPLRVHTVSGGGGERLRRLRRSLQSTGCLTRLQTHPPTHRMIHCDPARHLPTQPAPPARRRST